MKKVYLLGVVLSLGLSAVAAPNVAVKQAKYSATTANTEVFSGEEPIGDGIAINTATMAKAPAKTVSSTNDLLGLKQWSGIRMFGQKEYEGMIVNGPQEGVAFAADARPTRITINGFPASGLSTRMDIDLDKMEAYIANETPVGEVNQGKDEVYLYTRKINGDVVYDKELDLYKYTEGTTECEQAVGKILEDGTIFFEGYTIMASNPDMQNQEEPSWWLMINTSNIKFESRPFNTPDEAEYNYVGKGEFKDPFFAPLYDDPSIVPVNKNVDVYVKGDDEGILIAVKNPYKEVATTLVEDDGQTYEFTDFWKETGCMYEEASEDGWLLFKVFNVSDLKDYPDAVAMLMLVPCGMEMDMSELKDGSDVSMFYPYNILGNAYADNGVTGMVAQLEYNEANNIEWSTVEDNILYIRTQGFGVGNDPAAGLWWTNAKPIVGEVVLPEGWRAAGVNSVISDNENAPVKYYNLQGIELNTPVKGQLTIRKQGNKSTKFIAR